MASTKVATLLLLFVAAATIAAPAQTQVFVPGNASGYFGNPTDYVFPFVPAITVDGAATITVTYIDGIVTWDTAGDTTGPDGTSACKACKGQQPPLNEAHGLGEIPNITHLCALIGAFVPQSRVQDHRGFTAVDGTKNIARVGIMPGTLFFIGEGKTFEVDEAGTLFLGINDTAVFDNSGGFNVEVSVQQH